jgi:hypothetical protein
VIYFNDIRPTEHYLEHHEKDVPWHEVVGIIFGTKNPRKKGAKFEIEKDGYYILFEVRNNIIYVINAKHG